MARGKLALGVALALATALTAATEPHHRHSPPETPCLTMGEVDHLLGVALDTGIISARQRAELAGLFIASPLTAARATDQHSRPTLASSLAQISEQMRSYLDLMAVQTNSPLSSSSLDLMRASMVQLSAQLNQATDEVLQHGRQLYDHGSVHSLGAMLKLTGAMVLFATMAILFVVGWKRMGAKSVFLLGVTYCAAFLALGAHMWYSDSGYKVPGGLLVTMSVCMVPLTVHGLQELLSIAEQTPMRHLVHAPFHLKTIQYIHTALVTRMPGKWIVMELATTCVGLVMLQFFEFPYLLAPVTFSVYFLALDVPDLLLGNVTTTSMKPWVSLLFGAILLTAAVDVDIFHGITPVYSDWASLLWLLGIAIFYPSHTFLTLAFLYTWGWEGIKSLPHLINTNQRVTGRMVWFTTFHMAIILTSLLLTGRHLPLVLSCVMVCPGFIVGPMVSRKWMPALTWVFSTALILAAFAMNERRAAAVRGGGALVAASGHASVARLVPVCAVFPLAVEVLVFVTGAVGVVSVCLVRLFRRHKPRKQPLAAAFLAALSFSIVLLSACAQHWVYGLVVAILGTLGLFLSILRLHPRAVADHLSCLFCLRMCLFARVIDNSPLLFLMGCCCLASALVFLDRPRLPWLPNSGPQQAGRAGGDNSNSGNSGGNSRGRWRAWALAPPLSHPWYTLMYSMALALLAAPVNSTFIAALGFFGIFVFLVHMSLTPGQVRFAQFCLVAAVGAAFVGGGVLWERYREQVFVFARDAIPKALQPRLYVYFCATNQHELVDELVGWFASVAAVFQGRSLPFTR